MIDMPIAAVANSILVVYPMLEKKSMMDFCNTLLMQPIWPKIKADWIFYHLVEAVWESFKNESK